MTHPATVLFAVRVPKTNDELSGPAPLSLNKIADVSRGPLELMVMQICKCTIAQKMAGDGCSVCNPTKALEYAQETINEQKAAMQIAAYTIRELCDTFNVPYPQTTLKRLDS